MIGRRALTILEMLVTVTVLAFVVMMAAPALSDENRLRLTAAARMLSGDIELAQILNMTAPQDPVILRFDPATSRYWLADPAAPLVAVPAGDGDDPYLVQFGAGRALEAHGVTVQLEGMTDQSLAFTAMGTLEPLGTVPAIILRRGTRSVRIEIAPSTGTITLE